MSSHLGFAPKLAETQVKPLYLWIMVLLFLLTANIDIIGLPDPYQISVSCAKETSFREQNKETLRSVFQCKQTIPNLRMAVKSLKTCNPFSQKYETKYSLQIGSQCYPFLHNSIYQLHIICIDIKMVSPQSNDFNFPYFPPPPHTFQPPPPHPFHPPPPAAKPPRPSKSPPPPTPSHHFPPPPPHVRPPPPHVLPPPPAPSPNNNPTVIVIVFISFGGLFFLAFLAAAVFCFIKRRKKKEVQETDMIHFDEHRKVNEIIVPGPHGPQAVILSVEDDVHIDEVIRKDEKFGEGLHANSAEGKPGTSSSGFDHHHLEHKA